MPNILICLDDQYVYLSNQNVIMIILTYFPNQTEIGHLLYVVWWLACNTLNAAHQVRVCVGEHGITSYTTSVSDSPTSVQTNEETNKSKISL